MSADFEFRLTSSNAVPELNAFVSTLQRRLEDELGKGAHVNLGEDDNENGDDVYRRSVFVHAPGGGTLELYVGWEKDEGVVEIDFASSVTLGKPWSYAPVVLAFGAAFLADQSPELLPFFRGIRVFLGAFAGWFLGFVVITLLGVVMAGSKKQVPAELKEKVRGVVGAVVTERHPVGNIAEAV